MNKKIQLGAALLGVILTTALVAGATYAFPSGFKGGMGNFEKEKGGFMHDALEAGDYSLLGDNPKITEEQFNNLLKQYNANDGKMFMMGRERGGMRGGMRMSDEKREAVQAALSADDYNAWLTAVGENCPILDKIDTAEKFARYAEAYKLMEQGREIMEEFGIKERGVDSERQEFLENSYLKEKYLTPDYIKEKLEDISQELKEKYPDYFTSITVVGGVANGSFMLRLKEEKNPATDLD